MAYAFVALMGFFAGGVMTEQNVSRRGAMMFFCGLSGVASLISAANNL